MRLIDADKLMRFFTVDTANQTYRFGTIKKQIENAETIQAIPIPDNATNGGIMKTMFPNIEADEVKTNTGGYIEVKYLDTTDECDAIAFRRVWWDAPYERM